jgi:glycosyltransferase involved in cell wall biosynthesis
MAAYNGEKYIGEQIESILNQTYNDWTLVIKDDRSTDGTLRIAKDYAKMYPYKIKVLTHEVNTGNASDNFFSLLQHADSDYIMFADDDDVWASEKMSMSIKKMEHLETKYGLDKPFLVHSDLEVVDSKLQRVSKSLFAWQRLDWKHNSLNYLLAQNIVTGCTMMVNKHLLNMIGEPPKNAIIHDWWFALVAAAFGKIGFIESQIVKYRQHGMNQIGAKNAKSIRYYFKRLRSMGQTKKEMDATCIQAKEFLEIYEAYMDIKTKQMLEQYISLPEESFIGRIRILRKYRFWKSGLLRKLGQILMKHSVFIIESQRDLK